MQRFFLHLFLLFCWCAPSLYSLEGEHSEYADVHYANPLRGFLIRSCMYGFGISGMKSHYDPSKRDRLWKIDCKRVGFRGGEDCKWTRK